MPDYLQIYKILLIPAHLSQPEKLALDLEWATSRILADRKSLIRDDLARVEQSEILYLDCWSHLDIIELMGSAREPECLGPVSTANYFGISRYCRF